mgnify:CR=1 FL=1
MSAPSASPPALPRFVVITAVRDEERFLPRTIASMAAQTAQPAAWVVVDDGSMDGTAGILAEASARLPRMRVVTLPREPHGSAGEAASLAFNRVLPLAREEDPDAVAMLDADTEFEPDFYERLLGALSADPRLGIAGAGRVGCGNDRSTRDGGGQQQWRADGDGQGYRGSGGPAGGGRVGCHPGSLLG